ncbi:MAG: TonB-dependent receptor [Deltaproteobacteria bacterium]|nr:TonB-dependent receptor [Deltaproteobacteria bacterium]
MPGSIKLVLLLCSIALISLSQPVWAHEKDTSENRGKTNNEKARTDKKKKKPKALIYETRVMATRINSDPEKIPFEVQVLNKRDWQDWNVQTLDEAFSNLTGVWVRHAKPMDSLAGVFIRGFGSNKQNLVMINGIPMNGGYSGGVPWWAISPDMADRIELLSGPASPAYGGYAMGGVINIRSFEPVKRKIELDTTAGSFSTGRLAGSYGEKLTDWFSLKVSAHWTYIGGYPTAEVVRTEKTGSGEIAASGWNKTTTSKGDPAYLVGDKGNNHDNVWGANIDLYFHPWKFLDLNIGYTEGRFNYGYSDAHTYLFTDSGEPIYSGKITADDTHYFSLSPYNMMENFSENICRIARIRTKATITNWLSLSAKLGAVHREGWYSMPKSGADNFGGPGKYNFTQSLNVYSELQLNAALFAGNNLAGGLSLFFPAAASVSESLGNWRDTGTRNGMLTSTQGKAFNGGLFLLDQWSILHDKIIVSAGARLDIWRNYDGKSEDVQAGLKDTYPANNETAINPRIGVSYHPWKFLGFNFAAGRAFRPPTVYELYKTWSFYGTTYKPNPKLKPERTWSWEAGLVSRIRQIGFKSNIVWFMSFVDNMIYTASIDEKTKQKLNAAEARVEGLELKLSERVTKWLELGAGLTYQYPRITSNSARPQTEGKITTYMPKNIYFGWLGMKFEGLTFRLRGSWIGKAYRDDENRDTYSGVYGSFDEHFLLDAALHYQIGKHFRVGVLANNILDKHYYSYYRSPGRAVYLNAMARY